MDTKKRELVMIETDTFVNVQDGNTFIMLPPREEWEGSTPPYWIYLADKCAIELKDALVKIYGK